MNKRISNIITISLIFIIVGLFLYSKSFTNVSYAASNSTITMTKATKIMQEVMYSYYMRGPKIQYNSLKVNYFTPESATSQDTNYMVCSGYTRNVYYELLGFKVPSTTTTLLTYAQTHFGNKEVILYGTKKGSGNLLQVYDETQKKYISFTSPTIDKIIPYLKVGDILTYTGHTFLIYDYIYDSNGKVVDLYTIESGHGKSGYNAKTKITSNITVSSSLKFGSGNHLLYHNSRTSGFPDGREEGSLHMNTITKIATWRELEKTKKAEYSVLRFIQPDKNGNAVLYFDDGNKYFNGEALSLPSKSLDRYKYSRLYIDKTVNVSANDVVENGDTLKYTIKIKNNSKSKYTDDLKVVENIPNNVVYKSNTSSKSSITGNYNSSSKKIEWNLGKLASGEEITLTYTVKVNKDCLNCTIEANGTVASIPTKVTNTIGFNLTSSQSSAIVDKYNSLKKTYTGKDLINRIYKDALGVDLKFNSFDITSLIKNTNLASNSASSLSINEDSYYSSMILNKYYSAIRKVTHPYNNENLLEFDLKWWAPYSDPLRKADTIESENFKTGDILVYKNSDDFTYSISNGVLTKNTVTKENGEYAYIFIEGSGFVGVNLGKDGKKGTSDDRNLFTSKYYSDNGLTVYSDETVTDKKTLDYMNYQTLFGKDYFVILRPSLLLNAKININYYQGNGTSTAGNKLIGTSTCSYNSTCTLKKYSALGATFPLSNNLWSFAGWSKTKTGTSIDYKDGGSFTINSFEDLNLYTVGKRKFTFSTGKNPTTASTPTYQYWNPYITSTSYVTSVTVPKQTDISGWTFIGFRGNNVASSTVTIKPEMANTNKYKPAPDSLTSTKFRSIYKREITLKYSANGGTGTTNSQKVYQYYNSGYGDGNSNSGANITNVEFKLAKNNFTYSKHSFEAWTNDLNSSNRYKEDSTYDKLNPSLESTKTTQTLYAVWKELFDYSIDNYDVDSSKKYIKKIEPNTDLTAFKKHIQLNSEYSVSVDTKKSGTKELIYTGGKTKINKNGKSYQEFTNIVSGDNNGDGLINKQDYTNIYNHIYKTKHSSSEYSLLTGIYLDASDLSHDNKISYLDYVKTYNKMKGVK